MYSNQDSDRIKSELSAKARKELDVYQEYIFNRWLEFLKCGMEHFISVTGFMCVFHDDYKIKKKFVADNVDAAARRFSAAELYSELKDAYITCNRFTEMQACALLMHTKTDARTFFSNNQEALSTRAYGWDNATLTQIFKAYENTGIGPLLNRAGTIFVNGYAVMDMKG